MLPTAPRQAEESMGDPSGRHRGQLPPSSEIEIRPMRHLPLAS